MRFLGCTLGLVSAVLALVVGLLVGSAEAYRPVGAAMTAPEVRGPSPGLPSSIASSSTGPKQTEVHGGVVLLFSAAAGFLLASLLAARSFAGPTAAAGLLLASVLALAYAMSPGVILLAIAAAAQLASASLALLLWRRHARPRQPHVGPT